MTTHGPGGYKSAIETLMPIMPRLAHSLQAAYDERFMQREVAPGDATMNSQGQPIGFEGKQGFRERARANGLIGITPFLSLPPIQPEYDQTAPPPPPPGWIPPEPPTPPDPVPGTTPPPIIIIGAPPIWIEPGGGGVDPDDSSSSGSSSGSSSDSSSASGSSTSAADILP